MLPIGVVDALQCEALSQAVGQFVPQLVVVGRNADFFDIVAVEYHLTKVIGLAQPVVDFAKPAAYIVFDRRDSTKRLLKKQRL